jgi:integrase
MNNRPGTGSQMLYAARDPPAWQSVGTDRRADVEGFARIWKRRARAAVIRVDYESDVSEATGADIEHLGLEHGHWALTVARKGGKVVTVSLAPRTARAINLAIGERTDGPLLLVKGGQRLDRHFSDAVVADPSCAPTAPGIEPA